MKLVPVDRALKELQNDTLFPASCLVQALYLVKFNYLKVPVPALLSVCIFIYNNIRNSLMRKVSFCSYLKPLSTDTSFIKIEVCYQKLSTLEFNFHYQLSSHCVKFTRQAPIEIPDFLPMPLCWHVYSCSERNNNFD